MSEDKKNEIGNDAQMPANDEPMETIVLTFWNVNDDPSLKKSFRGRWLVSPDMHLRADDSEYEGNGRWDSGVEWAAAKSEKGNIVVYTTHCNDRYEPQM